MLRQVRTIAVNRNFCGFLVVLLIFGTVMLEWSFPQERKSFMIPIPPELDSTSKAVDPTMTTHEVTSQVFQMPPPISYFQHGNNGIKKDDASYCIHNSKSDDCCSKEHCATIVQRSTLYSECCDHVHNNNDTASRSRVFPLLITSAPRSGTWFMQQLMTKSGLQGLTTDEHSPDSTGIVSWKHIFHQDSYYFGRQSKTHLYNSKFRVIWHLVRDPLKTLTSIAFTDPLWEDSDHSKTYIQFISSHIPISNKTALMTRFNISYQDLEGVMQHRTVAMNHNPSLSRFLIFRGLEIYLYWNGFINYLNVPIFRLEDLADDKNVTILDEMFRSVGYNPPNHHKVLQVLDAQEGKRKEHHKQRRHLAKRKLQIGSAENARGHPIRKGSRIHRGTLTWQEICEVSLIKARALLRMSHSFGYYTNLPEDGLCA